jgi:hypothetical protein
MGSPRPSTDIIFDGNVLDLDRVFASCALQFILYSSQFGDDSLKSAFLLAHFRGPALDWAARVLERKPEALQNYLSFSNVVKNQFGYDSVQVQAIAQTQLAALHQKGNLLDFLIEFEDTCSRAGIAADTSKITFLLPKLNSYYRNALVVGGEPLTNYSSLRSHLINVHSRTTEVKATPEDQRSKARCKKCGKRGHTGTQCKAAN